MARPSIYNQEVADRLCEELATTSRSLKSICDDDDMPAMRTVLYWLDKGNSEDGSEEYKQFLRQYARAREAKADFLAEEIMEIADDGSNDFMTITKGDSSYEMENKEWTSRSKLRVDARKWAASKLAPKKYGDKLDLTSDGEKIPSTIPQVVVYNCAPPLANKEEDVN